LTQSLWCFKVTFFRCLSPVFMYRSHILSNHGCRGVESISQSLRCDNTHCCSHDSMFWPWSLCSSLKTMKHQKKLITRMFTIVSASWLGLM
jgi:hypothetical protein